MSAYVKAVLTFAAAATAAAAAAGPDNMPEWAQIALAALAAGFAAVGIIPPNRVLARMTKPATTAPVAQPVTVREWVEAWTPPEETYMTGYMDGYRQGLVHKNYTGDPPSHGGPHPTGFTDQRTLPPDPMSSL